MAPSGVGAPLGLALSPELRAVITAAVDHANQSVSRAESIREFALLPAELTIAAGALTPTLKVRRASVEKICRDVIGRIYADTTKTASDDRDHEARRLRLHA